MDYMDHLVYMVRQPPLTISVRTAEKIRRAATMLRIGYDPSQMRVERG